MCGCKYDQYLIIDTKSCLHKTSLGFVGLDGIPAVLNIFSMRTNRIYAAKSLNYVRGKKKSQPTTAVVTESCSGRGSHI
jgi:hypothetical protein